ncbi:MAG: acetylxylan esterase [Promethearchaeota archaeon]
MELQIKKLSFKDRLYVKKVYKRFKGKGEPDLNKIAKIIGSLEEWQKRAEIIKRGMLKGMELDPLPSRTPLNVVMHSVREYEEYSVRNVYFESVPGFFVTGTLYMPSKSHVTSKLKYLKSHPIVLKPHGHKKNKRYTESNQQICATFARMGAVVFTWDMVGYADSTQIEHKVLHAATFQTWNSMRSLDFVLSLKPPITPLPIDPKRVGVTGGSGGGTQTFYLTALDDRVKYSAPVVMVSSFFFGGCICESGLPIHKGEGYATNNAEIAALAAPRPQLIISDGKDWTRLVPVLEYPFIKNIYSLYNAEENIENAHFQSEGHDYGPSKRQAAYKFFSKYFNLETNWIKNSDGNIDESKNVLEKEKLLKVFDEEHPRPDYALKSENEILNTFKELQDHK